MKAKAFFAHLVTQADAIQDIEIRGIVVRVSGVMVEAKGLKISIGSICRITCEGDNPDVLAEAIGFSEDSTCLMTFEEPMGILPGAKIEYIEKKFQVPVGDALQGRILNGFCAPIDDQGPLGTLESYPLMNASINPVNRTLISKPLDVGIKSINGLLSVGIGQRLGIFAGSGVGKSVLLGMMTRFAHVQIIVVALIGERGREVKEFLEKNIGTEGLRRTVVIAAPIDASPLQRANGAQAAVTMAEYFRDQGMDVLLILDSLTRYAQALRQMYILLGEPPSSKGYSPSVFARISQLIERCGYGSHGKGSITAFFTVLVEGDDLDDPVADHARSVLDGHIVLSRRLAETAHYPAIDISQSISRVMKDVISPEHYQRALLFKQLYAHWMQNQDLINMGMYHEGHDKLLDTALQKKEQMLRFLRQDINTCDSFAETMHLLENLFPETGIA